MADREALLSLAKGRAKIRELVPYFMSTVVSFTPYETVEIATCAVSEKLTLLYNPEWLKKQTAEKVAGALAHEVGHVLNKHFSRRGPGHDPQRWNIAGDLAINPSVIRSGLQLPDGALMPTQYGLPENKTVEQYYELLEGQVGKSTPTVCGGDCGGVAGGKPGSIESRADETHGRSHAEVEQVVRSLKRELKDALHKTRGSLFGISSEELEADEGRVSWREALRGVISRQAGQLVSGAVDYSWKRPSRRSYADGYPRPSLVQRIPEVSIAIDTSGSMSSELLRAALGESVGILRATAAQSVWLIEADCQVACKPRRVPLRGLANCTLHGRGGTAFDPALQEVERLTPRPNLLVYLTDGEGQATYRPRGIRVVWGVLGGQTQWLQKDGWENVISITLPRRVGAIHAGFLAP